MNWKAGGVEACPWQLARPSTCDGREIGDLPGAITGTGTDQPTLALRQRPSLCYLE